jgi:hypothetical protein
MLYSNCDLLDLIHSNLIIPAVIELRHARRSVGGDRLGVLQQSIVLEVGGDAGRAKSVAASPRAEPGLQDLALERA